MYQRWSGRLYYRLLHKYFVRDLWFDLQMDAKRETIRYINEHMRHAKPARDRHEHMRNAADLVKAAGLQGHVLEFGVSSGKSIRWLAGWFPQVHGFDSFRGLPEEWSGTHGGAGLFDLGGRLPRVPANVTLHPGWFNETLPGWLEKNPGPVALANLDADIYSSTKTVLDLLTDRIQVGTVLVFDEYQGYWNWQEHEYKALQEWVQANGVSYSYVGFATGGGGQASIRIDAIAR